MAGYSLELCAGGGGQALGLERAGFKHAGLVEIDMHSCNTLRMNRPKWQVFEEDVKVFDARLFKGVDLVAAGFPCPPFSIAGQQLGAQDERDLFPAGLKIIDVVRPKAVMIENVRGILSPSFLEYRELIDEQLGKMGYETQWKLFNASDFGVPQLRPRVLIVALQKQFASNFNWPKYKKKPATVGATLIDLMSERGWRLADDWMRQAQNIAPTIVGGSKKHGGPDLGPTRARKAWAELGVNGISIANEAPEVEFQGMPRLTTRMVARIQGFPDHWGFWGAKTAAYRQVGNAFPPPVAAAVGKAIAKAIRPTSQANKKRTKIPAWHSAML